MSYRMYVKTTKRGRRYQFLGNNERPKYLIEELKKQGAEFNEDGLIRNFEIKEIQPVVDALEKYILDEYNYKKKYGVNIFDFEETIMKYKEHNLTHYLNYSRNNWYILVSSNFIDAISDSILDEYENGKWVYKIRKDKHIYIDAF